jgi:hypothetical protein
MLFSWLFFNFAMLFDIGCSSLVQKTRFLDHYLPYFRQHLITCPLSTHLSFQALFTESSWGDQLLVLPPFSGALRAPCPLCCVFLFSFLFIIQVFFFFAEWGISLSRGLCWFIPGVAVGIPRAAYLLTLLVCVSQAVLELGSGGAGALLFSQCEVVWRSFVRAGGSGCWSFASCWLFSAKCSSSISAKFLIYRAHTVFFLPLVAILDHPLCF